MGIAVAAASWLAVGALRRYALARGILDLPQGRSSHEVPTPRGGGAGVVLAAMVGFALAVPPTVLDWRLLLALLGVIPTAIVGWIDDRRSLPRLPRVTAYLITAAMLLPLAIQPPAPSSAMVVAAAWVMATISATIVVNFVDGIDGLVGLSAVVFGLHLALLAGFSSPGGMLGVAIASAAAGFLFWNWTPARIFLGDVGSGALAVLGVIGGIMVWRDTTWPVVSIFLPLFPLFLDAFLTILRRIHRGERILTAHRRLAREGGWGHARVTLLYGAAAAIGTIVVLAPDRAWLTAASAAYAAVIIATGLLLDRPLSR
jgi:Fuc2NAc and GlcNAc transferase